MSGEAPDVGHTTSLMMETELGARGAGEAGTAGAAAFIVDRALSPFRVTLTENSAHAAVIPSTLECV